MGSGVDRKRGLGHTMRRRGRVSDIIMEWRYEVK